MKIVTLRGYTNTIILIGILVVNAIYESELGGSGTIYNSIGFLLAVAFCFLNHHICRSLATFFIVPILFLALSAVVNLSHTQSGGFNSMVAIFVGYVLLTLQPFTLDRVLMRRLIILYLIASLILSLYVTRDNLSLYLVTGNANFNLNPNAASIFFSSCLILSLVFTKSFLRWALVIMTSLLVLTTGSRAGLIVCPMLLAGYVFFGMEGQHRRFLTKSKIAFLVVVATIPLLASYLIPDSMGYIMSRVSNTGLVSTSNLTRPTGHDRDDIWQDALELSGRSLKSVLFGYGPATAVDLIDSGTHSSYVEAITSAGWPFLIFTLLALLFLFRYHIKHGQREFLIYAIPILIYGMVETVLFNGLGNLWYILIFLSLYYRSTGSDQVLPKGKYVNHYC